MAEPMPQELGLCVVTPSYNQGAYVERTIRSVLDQDVEGLDYVVVDGGSDDATVDVLRRFDGRLRWVSEPDEGQADAVNKGLARTSAELIGWLNSDDVYYPGALARVRAYFAEHPEVDVVYGDAHHIDESGAVLEPYYCEPWDPERLPEVCFLCQPAVFFRRRVVERCGPLDVRLSYCLDYEYWLRLARQGMRFAYLREVLAGSRLYASNKTLGQRVPVHAETNGMLRRVLGEVPDRWLSNYAHAVLTERGWTRENGQLRFAVGVSLLSWLTALRWNHRVSRSLWRTTWGWMRGASPSLPSPPGRGAGGEGSPSGRGAGGARLRGARLRGARLRGARLRGARLRGEGSPSGRGLRIGFDISQTGTQKAGCGYEADSLIQALAAIDERNEYVLYPTFGDDFWDPGGPEATRRIEQPSFRRGLTHPSHLAAREFWRDPPADLEARLGDPDIVHSHNFFCPTRLRHARLVYTVHDLGFLVHPEWTTEHNRQICFAGVFNASLCADLVLAVSESTRRHFLETFPHYPAERTAVAYLASRFTDASPVARPRSFSRLDPERFFLNVGTVEPRKNQLRLLQAYAAHVEKDDDPLPLAMAGGRGWLMEDFERQIEELGLAQHVHCLGYVDDRSLAWLYQNCFAFLYPSLFEGFGLPVVEALSQGAAVITSRITSLPEVVGDAALLVDPTDEADIGLAIERLTGDDELRSGLREKAPRQAARFSWSKTAEKVLSCYERVVEMDKYSSDPGSSLHT